MTAVSVAANNTRVAVGTIATDTGTWGNDGGGGGVADEPDIVYQGSTAQSRKVGTTPIGRSYTHGSGTDMDGTPAATAHWIAKVNATNSAALLARSAPAMQVKIGSGSGDYYLYSIFGNDNYPPRGGWQILAIAPSVSGYRDGTTGSPALGAVLYWSILADFSAVSKGENLCIDAIDVGLGLHLVGGDGADPDGDFADFVAYDEGTLGNRFGYVYTEAGVVFATGQLAIGVTVAGTSTLTVFTDSGGTVVWTNGLVTTGFNRLLIDLATAGTTVALTNYSLGSRGRANNDGDRGYSTTEDSRPVFEVSGANATASLSLLSCVLDKWASFTLNARCDLTNSVITNSGAIAAGTGATLNGVAVSGYTGAADTSAIEWTENLDPDGYLDDVTITKGTNAHHGISLGTASPTTVTLRGLTAVGFNAADAQNDSFFHVLRTTGTVTINVVGGTGNFKYKSAGATVVIVQDPVALTVNVFDGDTQAAIQNARVWVWCSGTGPFPSGASVSIVQAAGTATVTHTSHGLATNDVVRITGCAEWQYNGFKTITVTGANTYTYAVDSGVASPATGAPLSALVLIEGALTDASGNVTDTRTYASDQGVTGSVKKGTSSPVYVGGSVSGTVDSGTGLLVGVPLTRDE